MKEIIRSDTNEKWVHSGIVEAGDILVAMGLFLLR
jgi:hypothetical protein